MTRTEDSDDVATVGKREWRCEILTLIKSFLDQLILRDKTGLLQSVFNDSDQSSLSTTIIFEVLLTSKMPFGSVEVNGKWKSSALDYCERFLLSETSLSFKTSISATRPEY